MDGFTTDSPALFYEAGILTLAVLDVAFAGQA